MKRPRIGLSACFLHADPTRNLFKGKTLLYAEESMLQWLMAGGALPIMLPRVTAPISPAELLEGIDGLVLQGGADMSPKHYGEEPLRPEWSGDPARDVYEMELVRLCLEADKPVLGICRGAQVLNVALGGSLFQDIETLHPGQRVHRNWEIYDEHAHELIFERDSWLGRWYAGAGVEPPRVNSVHHQGLNRLGRGLAIDARSVPDGVVEAVRYEGSPAFAYGVQWHPEFIRPGMGLLDPQILLQAFLEQVDRRRQGSPMTPEAPGRSVAP